MTSVASEPRLTDLFLRLADDPSLLEAYGRDPRSALAAAGLGAAEIDTALRSPEAMRTAVEAELTTDPALRRLVTTPRMSTETPGELEPDKPSEPDEPSDPDEGSEPDEPSDDPWESRPA